MGAVRVRLHRARETLRRELAPHAPVTYIRKERSMIEMVVDDVIVRVERVAVTRLEETTFYATVTVDGADVDARPSDAINLADRAGAPILVADEVLQTAAVSREALDAKCDSANIPEGEWRSLSRELLETLHRMPRQI